MAPMRGERGGSPARGARPALPLSRRLIRQIARHVASSGRSLRRLEVSGRVIENFDDLDYGTDDSDHEMPITAVACGGNSGNLPPPDHDDDLKSLSWLQDKNLLRGINLSKGDVEDNHRTIGSHVIVKTEPITPPPLSRPISPPKTPIKSPPSPPSPPPNLPVHIKPPYSFSCLIFMAIEAAPTRALPVKEIYAWIIKHFPYFRTAPQGWKNSVRHNLSLNKCFHKVAAAPGLGKGSLWTVDPQHRSTLLQAFGRAPAPVAESEITRRIEPPTHLVKRFEEPTDLVQRYEQSGELAQRFEQSGDLVQRFEQSGELVQRYEQSGELVQRFEQSEEFVRQRGDIVMNIAQSGEFVKQIEQIDKPRDLVRRFDKSGDFVKRFEQPGDLFRRLEQPGADEYLAAATVLAMKYGPSVLEQLPPEASLVISRCARDEHSYSGCEERRTAEALLNLAGITPAPS